MNSSTTSNQAKSVESINGDIVKPSNSFFTSTKGPQNGKHDIDSHPSKPNRCWEAVKTQLGVAAFGFKYIFAEIIREPKSYLLGWFTVFLMVFFVVLLANAVLRSPLIFMRLSEVQSGEMDFLYTPGLGIADSVVLRPTGTIPFMDAKLFDQAASQPEVSQVIAGAAHRWLLIGTLERDLTSTMVTTSPFDPSHPFYEHFKQTMLPSHGSGSVTKQTKSSSSRATLNLDVTRANAIVLGMDSDREKQVGIGRKWSYGPVQSGETYVSDNILQGLGFTGNVKDAIGKTLNLHIPTTTTLLAAIGSSISLNTEGLVPKQALATILSKLDPTKDWTVELKKPIFPGGAGMTKDIDVFQYVDLQLIIDRVIQAINLIPIIGPEVLDELDEINLSLSVNTIGDLQQQIFIAPYALDLPDGRIHSITRQFPSAFPTSTQTFIVKAEKAAGTNPIRFIVDKVATNASFNIALRNSMPSQATFGDALQFYMTGLILAAEFYSPLTVRETIDSYDGKFAESIGQVMVVEKSWLLPSLKSTLAKGIRGTSYLHPVVPTVPIDIAPFINGMGLVYKGKPVIIGPTPIDVPTSSATVPVSLVNAFMMTGTMTPQQAQDAVEGIATVVETIPLEDFSPYTIAQFAKREDVYKKGKGGMQEAIIQTSDLIASALGEYFPATVTTPISSALTALDFIRIFLDNIFYAVIALITGLGAMLVYSLLLNDADSKTYEYGMLRALGMKKGQLFFILFTKSAFFSIMGIVTGLLAAYLVGIFIIDLISDYAAIESDYGLESLALGLGIGVGILMPILANISPVARALSKTLRDSLDVYHHVISDVTVKMRRLADLGLELWVTAIAVFLVVAGFTTFYFIPYAFVFGNFGLFLGLLMLILLCMMLGLCMLAELIQPYLERFWLRVLTMPIHRNLYRVCVKNLAAHRGRNTKTARMFTISLAFVIFAGVMFSLQRISIANNVRTFMGSSLVFKKRFTPDQEQNIRQYLDAQIALTKNGSPAGVVEAYTFVTPALRDMRFLDDVRFSNLPQSLRVKQKFFGIDESYYQAIFQDLYDDISTNTKDIAVKGIFEEAGNRVLPIEEAGHADVPLPLTGLRHAYIPDIFTTVHEDAMEQRRKFRDDAYSSYVDVIVSQGLQAELAVDFDSPTRIDFGVVAASGQYTKLSHMAKIRGFSKHSPGFTFSSYGKLATSTGTVLMTQDSFKKVMDNAGHVAGRPNVPLEKARLLVKTKKDSTKEQRAMITSGVSIFMSSSYTGTMEGTVMDTDSSVESMQFAMDMLNIFFTVVGTIAMILCFIILWLSFTSNVQENAWEFGVLRAIGINTKQVIMIYVYESLAIILGCIITGTAIGLLVAISLTLQFNLFSEARFVMSFPVMLFCIQVGLALIVAVIASALPAYSFVKKGISDILRRT